MKTMLPCLAIAALLLGDARPAAAQSATCDGAVVIRTSYSVIQSNGSNTTVRYHAQIQNVDPQRRRLTARVPMLPRVGNAPVTAQTPPFLLNPFEQKDIALLAVTVNNPSGNGAPTPAQVIQHVRFLCSFG